MRVVKVVKASSSQEVAYVNAERVVWFEPGWGGETVLYLDGGIILNVRCPHAVMAEVLSECGGAYCDLTGEAEARAETENEG